MAAFVSHLESAIDGTRIPPGTLQTTHRDRPLWVRYDLEAVGRAVRREALRDRPQTMWRYRELLPIEHDEHLISLGETMTPLLECRRLARALGMANLWIKDESVLPTGSFKARGMAMAVSMAKRFGIKRVAVPTAGNAGGALAAYAARAGMECYVFMPVGAPVVNRYEAALHGARVFLVNGLISDCAQIVREGMDAMSWFDLSTLREPYRLEGKKTMGLELAEQLGWCLPDVILYPTGGGTGLIGMWKAFEELHRLGWLAGDHRPRMFGCQSTGCDPVVRAFQGGHRFAEPFTDPRTIAAGLCGPAALGDFMILDAIRESHGRAMSADESRLKEWMQMVGRLEGISLGPEAAVCVGVLEQALAEGHIDRDEHVILFSTGAAQKYVDAIRVDLPTLDHRHPIDWDALAG